MSTTCSASGDNLYAWREAKNHVDGVVGCPECGKPIKLQYMKKTDKFRTKIPYHLRRVRK
jgi:hypothetical protein